MSVRPRARGRRPDLDAPVYQGLSLGAFLALHYDRGLSVDFLGWLSIHGVTELERHPALRPAGLVIADKILFPGRYSRRRQSGACTAASAARDRASAAC